MTTSDLNNTAKSFFSQKAKIYTLGSLLIAAGALPVIYVAINQDPPAPKPVVEVPKQDDLAANSDSTLPKSLTGEAEGENFVMSDDFFKPHMAEKEEDEFAESKTPLPAPTKRIEKVSKDEVKANDLLNVMAFKDEPRNVPAPIQTHDVFVTPPEPVSSIVSPNPVSANQGKGETRFITQDDEDKKDQEIANLLTDKDYPNTVASIPYDLSRMLSTDSFIPCVMYTAINSEIPSKTVLAIVESDVAGFHGRNILIPKGSKIEGVYESLSSKHARRMQITWFKITRPDGVIIKLDAESADMAGAGGLAGYLDPRFKDRYGGALLLSTINAMAQMSVNVNNVQQQAAVESYSREFGTLTAQIIRENINALPIIMIRQGARFNIRPLQNIYFPKPQNKSVNASFFNE